MNLAHDFCPLYLYVDLRCSSAVQGDCDSLLTYVIGTKEQTLPLHGEEELN